MTSVVEVPLLRTSERSEYGRCRWAWDKAYVKRIKPASAAPPLRFGSLVHKALEPYYRKGIKRGPHPALTFAKLYEAELKQQAKLGFKDEDDEWNDAATLGETMLNGYVEHYGADDRWRVLATELPFQVPILHPRTGRLWFYYVGVVDLVAEDRETKFTGLVDHKTTKNDPTKIEYLGLDEQAGAYWRYGRQALYDLGLLRQDRELNGILFNFLKKKMPDDRPKNADGHYLNKPTTKQMRERLAATGRNSQAKELKGEDELVAALKRAKIDPYQLGEVSKVQPGPLFYRAPVYRNAAEGDKVHERVLEQMREMQMARRGKLAIYKTPGHIHSGMCQMCGFKDICELHESGADWEGMRDATMAEWYPYAEHEIYAGETR